MFGQIGLGEVLRGQIHKYKYTNTQIHKYSFVRFADRHNKCYIFEKEMVRPYEDLKNNVPMSLTCKYTIQIHKYTSTAYDQVPERPNMWYIFEKKIQ